MSTRIAAFVVASLFASLAWSQVIYLPVQYQYGGAYSYYYGGTDPQIFARAERESALLAFRPVDGALPRVYTDLLPFTNSYIYGFSPTYAYNQAYQSVPRYFRKAELLESGYMRDGVLIVPPTEPSVRRPVPMVVGDAIPSREKKGVIIIIPKKAAQSPTKPVSFVSAGDMR